MSSATTSGEPDPVRAALDRFLPAFPEGPRTVEQVAVADAVGRVCAQDIGATIDAPPYPRAIVEGYLANPADTTSASSDRPVTLSVAGVILPGDAPPQQVAAGTAWQVFTGSAVPAGPITVIKQWDTSRTGDNVLCKSASADRANIEEQGCDVKQGTVVVSQGTLLGPDEIAILAAQGLDSVPVAEKPTVGLFGSGNEVVPHTARLTPGAIWDCNTPALSALVTQEGGVPKSFGIVRDDFDLFLRALHAALPYCSMVVIAGGTAVGGREFVKDLVSALGTPGVLVNGVPMRSGKPLIMGVAGEIPIVCVAGHPPEALRGFRLFGVPALTRLIGRRSRPSD